MTRKEFQNIGDVFSDIGAKKSRAAAARFAGRDPSAERPGDVYAEACAQIALALAPDGFKFAKSGPRASRRSAGFTYTVSFQSSTTNVSGESVSLLLAANVASSQLKSWRSAQPHPYRTDEWVCGGLAHRLDPSSTFFEWNLADPTSRAAVIDDVVAFTRSVVLPYFALFESPIMVIDRLASGPLPAFELASSVEFALCFGDAERAQQVLRAFTSSRPDLQPSIAEALQRFMTAGPPRHLVTRYADQVALMALAYGLQWRAL